MLARHADVRVPENLLDDLNRHPRLGEERSGRVAKFVDRVKLLRARRAFSGFDSWSMWATVSPSRSVSTRRIKPRAAPAHEGRS